MAVNRVQWMLGAVAGIAGLIVAAPAIFGPLQYPFAVHSPLNAEGWCGLAVVLLILLRSTTDTGEREPPHSPDSTNTWRSWVLAASIAAIACLALSSNQDDYFLSDDFLIFRHAREFHFDARRYFGSGGGDGFFRPLTYISYGLTAPWSGSDPFKWHLPELALQAVNSALVFVLARQLRFSRSAAWFAGALFALHGSRPEAALWISGRFDLQSTFFVLVAAICFLASLDSRRSRPGVRRAILIAISLIAMTSAILTKESAYACPLLLAALLFFRNDQAALRERAWKLAPYFIVAACLFAYRWELFGDIGGYRNASGAPQVMAFHPLALIKTLAHRLWAILFFPIDWAIAPGILLGVATLVYAPALLWLASARADRRTAFAAFSWIVIASLPPLQLMLVGADLERSRYYYLPSVGFCLLLAAAGGIKRSAPLCAVLLIFQVGALEHNLIAWRVAARRAQSACITAASCARASSGRVLATGLPGVLRGAYLFHNGFPDCVALQDPALEGKVDTRDSAPTEDDSSRYACAFTWDDSLDELRRK